MMASASASIPPAAALYVRVCSVALGLTLAGTLGGALATAQSRPAADYIIGPSDILQVTVFGQEKLSGKFTVGSDGTFAYPYGDRVKAGGLTVQVVENDIRTRLGKDYLRDPRVSVSVETFRSQTVTVAGEVRTNRVLEFTGGMSILQALTQAGGPSDSAGTDALIIRTGDAGDTGQLEKTKNANGSTQIRIDLPKLQAGDPSQNIQLQSGDQVLVQAAGKVFVQGKVVKVGEIPYRRGMTVNQAVTLAGGPTETGSTSRIEIQRTVNGELKKVNAKLTDAVNPGDTIVVKPKYF
jgi:polysaccharide biosynthesis/export protein